MTQIVRRGARDAIAEWSFFEQQIQRVIDAADAGCAPEDVLTCIQQGRMQLWLEIQARAICITEIITYPRYSVLLIYMVAGEGARDWLAAGCQHLTQFAQTSGCKYLEFQGRPGWERYARQHGFTHKQVRMRKDV